VGKGRLGEGTQKRCYHHDARTANHSPLACKPFNANEPNVDFTMNVVGAHYRIHEPVSFLVNFGKRLDQPFLLVAEAIQKVGGYLAIKPRHVKPGIAGFHVVFSHYVLNYMPTIKTVKNWIKRLWPQKTPPQRVFIHENPWASAPLEVALPPAVPPPVSPAVAAECPCCKPVKESKLYADPAAARKALAERMSLRNR
jgi:hypothetical protein